MAVKKSFLLRIDQALYEEIRRWAASELRSTNGQIEFILKRWADARKRNGR